MFQHLQKVFNLTPVKGILRAVRERRHQKYLKRISSDLPVFPFYCIACNKYFQSFVPLSSYYDKKFASYGFPYSIHQAETLNTANYMCPNCKINDRDRLYAVYLQQRIVATKEYNLVEFAPSPQLSTFIKSFENIRHRTADLFMEDVDDKVDLLDLNMYKNDSFDIFICSHILEHVNNDVQAMRELYRILKPGGFGIAMVPLFKGVSTTIEDPSINDEALRWKYFGQEDHIRLYAREDYIQRLESVGFRVKQLGEQDFGTEIFRKHGISESSILYIVEK